MSSDKTGFISRTGTSSTVYPIKGIIISPGFLDWREKYAGHTKDELYQAYINSLATPENTREGVLFEQKRGSGAMLVKHSEKNTSVEQVVFLQAFITQILIENGYVINLTEEKQHENKDTSLIVYVKPSFRLPLVGEKTNQLFGNIHMEIRHNSFRVDYFKMIAHRYNDFRFDTGRTFAELIDLLFKS
jgi:hypothetical protein